MKKKFLVKMLARLILKRAYETDRGDLVISVSDLRDHTAQLAIECFDETKYTFNMSVNKQMMEDLGHNMVVAEYDKDTIEAQMKDDLAALKAARKQKR